MNHLTDNDQRAMVSSMLLCGLMTIVTALVLLFCAGDYASYLEFP